MSSARAGRTRPAAVIGYTAIVVYLLLVTALSFAGFDGFTRALVAVVGLLPLSMVLSLVIVVRLVRRRRTLTFGRREQWAVFAALGVVAVAALTGFLGGMLS